MTYKIQKDYTKQTFSFGYMLGICNGDGYMRKCGSGITVMTHSPDLGESTAKHWNNWTGLIAGHKQYQRVKQAPYQKEPKLATEYHTFCNSYEISRFLVTLKFGKKKSTIPNVVIESKNKRFIYGFLSGYFDSDGGISLCRVKAHNSLQWNRRVRCFFADENIKNQIKQLLINEGLNVGEYFRKNRDTWELYITRNKDILLFAKYIGFQMQSKKEKLKELLKTIGGK